jgi:hypothetical protein
MKIFDFMPKNIAEQTYWEKYHTQTYSTSHVFILFHSYISLKQVSELVQKSKQLKCTSISNKLNQNLLEE